MAINKNRVLGICVIIVLGVLFWQERRWFFPETTNTSAFLATKFEMPVQEVRKSLKKYGALLLNARDFQKRYPEQPLSAFSYISAVDFAEFLEGDNQIKIWYMSQLEMFKSTVVAKFSFKEDKLYSVVVIITPLLDVLSKKTPQEQSIFVRKAVHNTLLQSGYILVKNDKLGLASQYRYKKSASTIVLNENSSKKNGRITFSLLITYNSPVYARANEIKNREQNAF
ncbi:TPA: hypothetical protein ACT96X_002648 [Legionella pneumophila]|uniref:hypothetical protein n=1 Tax=Legionella pneumophila TaxID=446 RepID=UPI0007888732|nr:hypothetical protein [Legionella pneumophila]HAT3892523.1 hypothetical protein [Legionella pneumophila]HAT8124184.1 hypothetical protein [Legionella pneumophila]HAU1192501.1 hypothetical protein [Legionella pneumophila]HBD7103078.1 hypothetical protein [Legionella pneumophila]HCO4739590.1 hypothetical protein [Legionella pneumophila]